MFLKILSLSIAVLLTTACTRSAEAGGNVLVILGATLEQPGDAPIVPSVVIVEGNKIRIAGSQATVPIPPGSDKLPVIGAVIRPLEGSLIHAGAPANLELTLESGVRRIMREGRWIE